MAIFLDTGEVIGDRAWGWLRRVMTQTGPRVVWVVGARFETEAEAGPDSPVALFLREIGDEFLVRMSPAQVYQGPAPGGQFCIAPAFGAGRVPGARGRCQLTPVLIERSKTSQ